MEVMKHFFDSHTDLKTEEERIDLLFRIIQYVERQVVLFDSIEDSAFSTLNANTDPGTVRNLYEVASQQESCILLKKKWNILVLRLFSQHTRHNFIPIQCNPFSMI